jgi:hypothetical protein
MAEGEGGELGTGSLLESLGTIGGSGCMILGGDVGTRDTPSIRGRKKETLDRSLVSSSEFGRWSNGPKAPCSGSVWS